MLYYKHFIKTATLAILLLFSACTDFLSVQPQDQFLEEGVFGSVTSIHHALNGVYVNMSRIDSYGGQMTMTTVDVLAQYYNTAPMNFSQWNMVTNYDYAHEFAMSNFSSIWSTAFTNIMNINNFISRLNPVSQEVINSDRKNILLGEAHALRAFIHFDMLRLFGPVYSTNPTNQSIPYMTAANYNISPFLPANTVIDSILSDLTLAEEYLLNDPIRTAGGYEPINGIETEDDFYRMRSRRLNYFAVLALRARVSLYAGNQEEAATYALRTINETNGLFRWSSRNGTQANAQYPDRIFSSEVLFGIENIELYARHNSYFSSALIINAILTALPGRLDEIFANSDDFRRVSSWDTDPSTANYININTFYKFARVAVDPSGTNANVPFCQPLIRLSEMYYIMTECTGDVSYINSVRLNRGLPNISSLTGAALDTEIRNEYRREFWGEGQTFFYFKRKNLISIPGATSTANISLDAADYTVPIPLSELNNR